MLIRTIQPRMMPLAIQNSCEPHLIPIGDGNAPPPFSKFMTRTTMKSPTKSLTLNIGVERSSSKIFRSSFALSPPSMPSTPGCSPSWRSMSSKSSSPARFLSFSASFWLIFVSSLSLVPSGFKPRCRRICDSFLYIFTAFFRELLAVKESSRTSINVKNCSGKILFRNAPINAPAIVSGSITKIKSQSIRGRSARGCLFWVLRIMLASEPPKTVTFDKGIPCLGENPITKIYMGTKIPPPPIPPPAASMSPQIAKEKPILSLVERGNRSGWFSWYTGLWTWWRSESPFVKKRSRSCESSF
mmetsp:Transcript_17478/g.35936  ORF Transcript_17478/g.35936 Transcript_17478/m.35936 type:complete len:300 (-) Transcript_17478:274-1173(-)